MNKILILLIGILIFITACNKDKKQAKKDKKIIEKYIGDNNFNAQSTSSGLYYLIESQGTGVNPTIGSNVKVYYKGYLTDGSVFDESTTSGIVFNLSNVIEGWQEGIPFFKKGGVGKLFIPSALGYGNRSKPNIPANSVLIFDVKLIDVL